MKTLESGVDDMTMLVMVTVIRVFELAMQELDDLVRAISNLLQWLSAFRRRMLELWVAVRASLLAPSLRALVQACIVMSLIVVLERSFLGLVSLHAKVFRRRPAETRFKCDAIAEDEELGTLSYPMVLVQIPMYNEKEVYQLSIGAACRLQWPPDGMIVQVLDDSTDISVQVDSICFLLQFFPVLDLWSASLQELVKIECDYWSKNGVNIKYETRNGRAGHKAGNLKEGMKHSYAKGCQYIAMFDADFQPEPDFLARTVPFLVHNPRLALVQARWAFVNANECLLTRMQEISTDYHFLVEQEAGSCICNFFGFNGTAGVWRTRAIEDSGGWEDRTTAEDMDLAVRASLLGWDFVYVGDIKVKSELPSSLKAYRNQQHRWSCGPALLFKKMLREIIVAKGVPASKKFYMVYNFFIARRLVLVSFSLFFYSVLVPATVFFPEIRVPIWTLFNVPSVITLLNCAGTPRSLHLVPLWVLFENVMSLHRFRAFFIGLMEAPRADEWIVTKKFGSGGARPAKSDEEAKKRCNFTDRFHFPELCLGAFLLLSGYCDIVSRQDFLYLFIIPQAIQYIVVGLSLFGAGDSS